MVILTGAGQTGSHCNFQDFHSLSKEKKVSLVRPFLSEPGSESKIGRLGGAGRKMILRFCWHHGRLMRWEAKFYTPPHP